MAENDWLVDRFEAHRSQLRAVAYRMLGSKIEAEDALQESWLHLSRSDTSGVENIGGWLTTIVARVCLDMLRSRKSRPEEPSGLRLSEPVGGSENSRDPERDALLADSVGAALLVVLETLSPTERLAFVLHDMFAVPFDEIAPIVGCSSTAARQLASRARRRVRGTAPPAEADVTRQREVVAAFLAACRDSNFEALLAVLDPDVVVRGDGAAVRIGAESEARGPEAVVKTLFGRAHGAQRAIINGMPGAVWAPGGKPRVVFDFTLAHGKISEIELIAEPAGLAQLDLVILND